MSTGVVASFDEDEGWGAITCDDTPGGCWFHYTQWPAHIAPDVGLGSVVSFGWIRVDQDGFRYAVHGDVSLG